MVEDIFQRTYQDVITDRGDAVALYQDSKDAPQWVRGIMVPYAAEEKAVEPTLQPLPLDAVNEYNALKERYPDALVGYEQYATLSSTARMQSAFQNFLAASCWKRKPHSARLRCLVFHVNSGLLSNEALEAGGERLSVRPAGRWNHAQTK